MDHFNGIVPKERWMNDVLTELRQIRQLLERDSKSFKEEPEETDNREPEFKKRAYQKRNINNKRV